MLEFSFVSCVFKFLRHSVDELKNIWCGFRVKSPFSNFSNAMWTESKLINCGNVSYVYISSTITAIERVQMTYRVTLQIIWATPVTVTGHTAILGVIEGILFTPVTQPARDIRLAVTWASHVVTHVVYGSNRGTVTTWKRIIRWLNITLRTMLHSNLTKGKLFSYRQ